MTSSSFQPSNPFIRLGLAPPPQVRTRTDPRTPQNTPHSYECKLCLTIHGNEGNYLAHTQGKRHQQNLAKRAAREAAENPGALLQGGNKKARPAPRKTVKIGRPGYRVTKQFDHDTKQRSLLFQVDYPEIEEGAKPRHRFMSSYEQKVEAWDKKYQYVMFAAEPYEVISFKVPNAEIDKRGENKYFSHWEPDKKVYTLQVYFKNGPGPDANRAPVGGTGGYAQAGGYGGTGGYAVPASNLPPPPPPPGALPPQFAPPPM
jgi:splicing factor 3A subunit 2